MDRRAQGLRYPDRGAISVALVYRRFSVRDSLGKDHVLRATELAARGIEVHCFGMPDPRSPTVDGVVNHDIRPVVSSRNRYGYAVECASFARRATHELRRRRGTFTLVDVSGTDAWEADVVTVHGVARAEERLTASLSTRDRIRTMLGPILYPRMLHVRVVEGLQLRSPRLQRVIARTARVKRDLVHVHGYPENRIDVIPYPIDIDTFANGARGWLRPQLDLSPETPLVVFMGRLAREKGVRLAIRALTAVPEAHLVCVGGGETTSFDRDARRAGVHARTHFLDFTERPQDVLAEADVFVLPSLQDVWGIPVVEAMAAGVPVLVSEAAGASAAVREAHAGIVVPPDPDAFAAGLSTLLADRALRDRLAENGRAGARQYSPASHVDAVLQTYAAVLEQRAAAAPPADAIPRKQNYRSA